VVGDISIDSETLLVTDFVNLKIKLANILEVLIRIECVCIYS
jgi:hypothetical protein